SAVDVTKGAADHSPRGDGLGRLAGDGGRRQIKLLYGSFRENQTSTNRPQSHSCSRAGPRIVRHRAKRTLPMSSLTVGESTRTRVMCRKSVCPGGTARRWRSVSAIEPTERSG